MRADYFGIIRGESIIWRLMKNIHTNMTLFFPKLPEMKLKVKASCQAEVCV